MTLRIEKIKELDEARHPNNIKVGFVKEIEIKPEFVAPPQVGFRFNVGPYWSTSLVQEVLSHNTFRTFNSVYKWEVI